MKTSVEYKEKENILITTLLPVQKFCILLNILSCLKDICKIFMNALKNKY